MRQIPGRDNLHPRRGVARIQAAGQRRCLVGIAVPDHDTADRAYMTMGAYQMRCQCPRADHQHGRGIRPRQKGGGKRRGGGGTPDRQLHPVNAEQGLSRILIHQHVDTGNRRQATGGIGRHDRHRLDAEKALIPGRHDQQGALRPVIRKTDPVMMAGGCFAPCPEGILQCRNQPRIIQARGNGCGIEKFHGKTRPFR